MIQFPWDDDDSFSLCLDRFPNIPLDHLETRMASTEWDLSSAEEMALPGVDEERLEEPWIRSGSYLSDSTLSLEEIFPANDTLRARYLQQIHATFPYNNNNLHDLPYRHPTSTYGSTTPSSTLEPNKRTFHSPKPCILTLLFNRIRPMNKRRQEGYHQKPLPALPPMLPPHQTMNEPIVVTKESYMFITSYDDSIDPTMMPVGQKKKKKRTSMDSIWRYMDYFKRPFSR
ncbi:hypothetical protein A0J61_08524 [Choanephora cucurbitarum]|uniref:Uncharacterized protein n=1 Tax=Choanephora cucurbitarum TaxID=101091 RepID=A0A1C7N437_9FUNG|nr:hypothetical protein A0J61_08524 [Choanephora cucurbitarum]